jgi:hypothetical protein
LKTPASRAPQGGLLQTERPQRSPRDESDGRAGEQLNLDESLDLSGDILEHQHCRLLLRNRADDLDELAFEELVRQQHEVGKEDDHDQLIGRRHDANRARPYERAGVECFLLT